MDRYVFSSLFLRAQQASVGDPDNIERPAGAATTAATATAATKAVCTALSVSIVPEVVRNSARASLSLRLNLGVRFLHHFILARVHNVPFLVWYVLTAAAGAARISIFHRAIFIVWCHIHHHARLFYVQAWYEYSFQIHRARIFESERLLVSLDQPQHRRSSASAANQQQQ